MALAIKNKIQKAGSYVVDKAELITSAGVKENLIGAFVHIQFYEDIESGSITGQCLLNDLVDISTLGPIIGQEYLRLKLKTNTSKESDESIYDFTENMLFEMVETETINQSNVNDIELRNKVLQMKDEFSVRKIAEQLSNEGFKIGKTKVHDIINSAKE